MKETKGRHDPVEEFYMQVETFESQTDLLSWLSIAAFTGYVILHIMHSSWDVHAKFSFVLLTCLSVVWGYWTRFAMQPVADRLRRRLLIADATGVAITTEEQNLYWNNDEPQSIKRLLLNLAENTFFFPKLMRENISSQKTQVLIVSIMLVLSLRFGTVEIVELFAVLLLFSELLLGKLVRTIWAQNRMKSLHLEIIAALRLNESKQIQHMALALYLIGEYEYIKARASCRASARNFEKMNPIISIQWESYRKRIVSGDI